MKKPRGNSAAAATDSEKIKVKNEKPANDSAFHKASADKKELQKIKLHFAELEKKVSSLTKIKSDLELSLADPAIYGDKNKFLKAEADYKKSVKELEEVNAEYENVFEKMMDLES